ncbi:MAG: VOC family protein [Halieaceae bacterium]|nr:VOC family protein [Halieaceae bacterium]
MILGVHHAALAVPDIEAALAFYCGLLGFEVAMEKEIPSGLEDLSDALDIEDSGFKVRMIKKGNSCLELFEFNRSETGDARRPANRNGITHIALASDNIAEDYASMAEAGVVFNADLLGPAGSRFAYGRDPFGNVIEVLEHDPASPYSVDFQQA